jgi:hypothetical protein
VAAWGRGRVNDYTDVLEAARKSRLVLVKDLVAALEAEIAENAWARAFIKASTEEEMDELMATEAKVREVFGPRE